MVKKVLVFILFIFVMAAVIEPQNVQAGGDPLASPTPQETARIVAPEIIGINPMVLMSEGNQGDIHPSDIPSPLTAQHPELLDLPEYVSLKPQSSEDLVREHNHLDVPFQSQPDN